MAEPIYNTLEDYDALAATVFGLDTYKAADDDERTARLVRAEMRVNAVRYQGRKYLFTQAGEFPRIDADGCLIDSDPDTGAAVVPQAVLMAVLFEADSLDAEKDEKQEAIAAGLASQGVGGMSESYRDPAGSGTLRAWARLCDEAKVQLERYRSSWGKIL